MMPYLNQHNFLYRHAASLHGLSLSHSASFGHFLFPFYLTTLRNSHKISVIIYISLSYIQNLLTQFLKIHKFVLDKPFVSIYFMNSVGC